MPVHPLIPRCCLTACLLAALCLPTFAADKTAPPTILATETPPLAKKPLPTHASVPYGPHPRNVLDVWLAPTNQPTPVLVAIHGGGFYTGLKNANPTLLNACLDAGISVVAIAYRYSTDAIAPAPLLDGARAIQFVRAHANEWNLDPTRVACTGSSAGGTLSLWLALHDDLADPGSDDPVARESTRLTCAVAIDGQTTYDPRTIRQLFPEFDVTVHPAIPRLVGVEGQDLQRLTPEQYRLYEEAAPLTHVTPDDPPVLLIYSRELDVPVTTPSIGIHHPRFGVLLKDRMAAANAPCTLVTPSHPGPTPIDFLKQSFNLIKH